jgi:hypothetical protein
MGIGSFREYLIKRKERIIMGLAVAAVVFVLYVVVSLIMWNEANLSYGITFAFTASVLYFIVQRLLGYLVTRKEGVIEERKRL